MTLWQRLSWFCRSTWVSTKTVGIIYNSYSHHIILYENQKNVQFWKSIAHQLFGYFLKHSVPLSILFSHFITQMIMSNQMKKLYILGIHRWHLVLLEILLLRVSVSVLLLTLPSHKLVVYLEPIYQQFLGKLFLWACQ